MCVEKGKTKYEKIQELFKEHEELKMEAERAYSHYLSASDTHNKKQTALRNLEVEISKLIESDFKQIIRR